MVRAVPTLTEIVETLQTATRAEVGAHLAPWLDALDATGRWALLKLVTGSLRIGVSARLAKLALAEWSGADITKIEEVWHALTPPYPALFAWFEGRAAPPVTGELPTFCPLMLAQALEEGDLVGLDPRDYAAEWKWDGIRVQVVARGGERRLYSRSGDDIGAAFPDVLAALPDSVTLDGELLSERLGAMALRSEKVKTIRGAGMIWGVEIDGAAGEVIARALEAGLLVITAGANVVRIVPPLSASDEELAEGLAILESVL